MDLSSMLSGLGGGAGGLDPGKVIGAVQETFASKGGVDGLLGTLRSGGLGGAVDSWVSPGPNEPVSPEQVSSALGPDNVNQIATKSGISIQMLLPLLATFLPMIIDRLTPDGNEPKTGADGGLGQVGDLLGGILGNR
jgi:uncharacterized protein YidB (DUF937 family)